MPNDAYKKKQLGSGFPLKIYVLYYFIFVIPIYHKLAKWIKQIN